MLGVAEDIGARSVGVWGTAGVKTVDVVSAVLVQIFKAEACVVCKNNLVQCVPQGSLDMLDCCDLVVTFAFEKSQMAVLME